MSFSRDEFADLVYDALNHLYDFPYLQRHPLIRAMTDQVTTTQKIQSLRRALLDAIQAMSPKPGVPADEPTSGRRACSMSRQDHIHRHPLQRRCPKSRDDR